MSEMDLAHWANKSSDKDKHQATFEPSIMSYNRKQKEKKTKQ